MDRLLLYPLAAALALAATPARAADDGGASGGGEAAEPIVVTGQQVKYGARTTSTATKTPTDLKDIPQALTVVTARQIEDQQFRSVGDLLPYVPGASYGGGEGNRDQLVIRGNSSTADFFVDGVRDDVQYFRDFYNVERVEVLKGPNAMIFGRGGGGGVVNRVMKRPMLNGRSAVDASADNWSDLRLAADVDEPLGRTIGLRINAMVEDGDSFRRHVGGRRYGINPTAAFVGSNTRIDLSYEHFRDSRTADRGVPADGDGPLRGFTRTFFGDPHLSFARADVDLVTVGAEQDVGSGLKLRNRTLFGDYRKFYQNVFGSGFDRQTNLVSLRGYNNLTNRRSIFSQTDLVWETRLAGLDQTILFGFEIGRETSRNRHLTATLLSGNTTPISDPTVDADVVFAASPTDADNRATASIGAAYVQDQLRLSPGLEIVAGLRLDKLRIELDDLRSGVGGRFARRDILFSPRLGLIAKPQSSLSLYLSYSRSFLPQSGDQFSSLTDVTDGLKPERFDNYEFGAKWEVLDGLLATAAVYQLDRSNSRATDPLDPSRIVLTGKQRSRGLELGLERNITGRWLVSGGYSLQKAVIVSPTSFAPAGRQVPLVPRHSFSLWNRYDVNNKLGVGLGVIARSRSYASISNAVRLPGYVRADAALFFALPNGIDAQLNVENLVGAHYFPTASNDNNIAPGAPRTLTARIGFSF